MAPTTPQILIYRGECENRMNCLKNDLKELLERERQERKEGEVDLKQEIADCMLPVREDIKSIKTAAWSITSAAIIAVFVYILGKV